MKLKIAGRGLGSGERTHHRKEAGCGVLLGKVFVLAHMRWRGRELDGSRTGNLSP